MIKSADYMRAALKEAQQAEILGEVPIGAVVVYQGKIVGRGHNMREKFQDATYHAEMLALMEACTTLGTWRLTGCQLYVTLEPCIMCAGAIVNARIDELYYAARDPKAGGVASLYELLNDQRLNHQVVVHEGLLQARASGMLKDFFKAIRKRKKAQRRAAKQKDWSRPAK